MFQPKVQIRQLHFQKKLENVLNLADLDFPCMYLQVSKLGKQIIKNLIVAPHIFRPHLNKCESKDIYIPGVPKKTVQCLILYNSKTTKAISMKYIATHSERNNLDKLTYYTLI